MPTANRIRYSNSTMTPVSYNPSLGRRPDPYQAGYLVSGGTSGLGDADAQAVAARQQVLDAQKKAADAEAAGLIAQAEYWRQEARRAAEQEAEQKRRQAEADRRQKEQDAKDLAEENASRGSAYDAAAQPFIDLGMDGAQIKAALKTVGRYDFGNRTLLENTIRSTQTWQDRFGAIFKARRDAHMEPLAEADVVGLESQYRQRLSKYGLPESFYDQPEDFQNWIVKDVSPDEVEARAQLASGMANSVDQGTKDAFSKYWGVGQGDLTAYFLDRTRATDLLEKQARAAQLGSEADAAGVGGLNAGLFETLAGEGTTRKDFHDAAEKTGVTQEDWKRLAQVGGENLTQASLLNANLGRDVATEKKLGKLASQERGRFAGSGGGTAALGSSSVGAY